MYLSIWKQNNNNNRIHIFFKCNIVIFWNLSKYFYTYTISYFVAVQHLNKTYRVVSENTPEEYCNEQFMHYGIVILDLFSFALIILYF